MALQYSAAVAAAKLDTIESTIGTAAVLKIHSGSIPANVAAARTGTVLATLTLPSDWMAAASANTKAKSGTWTDASADASGTAGYFTIFASDGTTAHIQGTVGTSATDMIVDSVSFTAGQSFTVNTFTITGGNYP
jgi:hypothetical protein